MHGVSTHVVSEGLILKMRFLLKPSKPDESDSEDKSKVPVFADTQVAVHSIVLWV